jgi:hydrogenase nickel incorporation protein HypA/HybF
LHELSLCQAIVDTVVDHADGRPVRCVNVRIGHLRQVVPQSLQFSWQVITDGSDLAGAQLYVEHVPASVTCRSCGARTTLERPLLICGVCEGSDVQVLTGEEFQIASIDVVEAVT